MESAVLFLWEGWGILGRVIAFLAIVVFVLGIESVVLKLMADIHVWRRRWAGPTLEMLRRKPEESVAILVTITGPALLAGTMLARLKRSVQYDNYMIFVAVRTIDAQTLAAVRRKTRGDSKVQICPMETSDAATDARALNTLLAAVGRFEQENAVDFQSYLIQGPETILHPLTLKLVNWHCEFASIVQLPVLTGPRRTLPLNGGAGLDDLGEYHARETRLRASMVHSVPVRETGVALRRDAIRALRLRGDSFDEATEMPVFDAVRRLGERGYAATFAWQRDARRKVIAVEELAPRSYSAAVRAKAARLRVTAFSGWRPLGSPQGSVWTHFFNYRDRRAVVVAATWGCAALTALAAAALLGAGMLVPGFDTTPRVIDAPWVIALLAIDAALLAAALARRIVLTSRVRGLAATLMLPLDLASSALIGAHGVLLASRAPAGANTAAGTGSSSSALPEGSDLASGKAKITDILVASGAMGREEAKLAARYSRRTGRNLMLALQDLRLVDGPTIAKGLAAKLGLEFGHIDGPLDNYSSVFLSRREAERFSAFAQRAQDGGIDVYVGEDYPMREWRALRAALRRSGVHRPHFKVAPLGEIAYAIRFAGTAQEMAVEQAIAVSLMDGPIPEGSARDIRRLLRGPYRRLEDILVERGLIGSRRIRNLRRRIDGNGPDLENALSRDRRIPPFTLADTVREFNAWRPAIAPLTSAAPSARVDQSFKAEDVSASRLAA
ncbi:hypothetical protein AAG612_13085 [Citromicrobium bathyomarinum]|uniref:hypothetical protein n=1 Tax=Citromicrobium bathyomarinum TaxID=72174 RepID=UPI003159A906